MNKKIIKRCIQIAIENNTPEKLTEWGCYHHFSFLVQNNKIVAWDTNKAATPLGYYPRSAKLHSEPEAYFAGRSLLERNKPFEMVNIRLDKSNNLKISQPCVCCYNFLKKFNCKKVYFSIDNNLPFGIIKL